MRVFHSHVGYASAGSKRAIVEADERLASSRFSLYPLGGAEPALTGSLTAVGRVEGWRDWHFWEADFSALTTPGEYVLTIEGIPGLVSAPFTIAEESPYSRQMASDLVSYFKAMRSSGIWDAADRQCRILGSENRVDVHGGWIDASGDASKYLSHLSFANYMNPQQTPQLVWNLIEGRSRLAELDDWLEDRLVDEALHGADFLTRMQHPAGFFYMTVFDGWSLDVDRREICAYVGADGEKTGAYQAAFRQGGGSAVAALARASQLPRDGEKARTEYLACAIRGFDHLQVHNTDYLDDGAENIIDDYCALLAATELFAATREERFAEAANVRAQNLIARQHADGWFYANDAKTRSYFHAVDAGMPLTAMLRFLDVMSPSALRDDVERSLQRALQHEIAITFEGAPNPFAYPRQYVLMPDADGRAQFFIPRANESGYWWQGENARVASLACAMEWAAAHFRDDATFVASARHYAQACREWIFGFNPFDITMMQGQGRNNPLYAEGEWNVPGGVCNGITSGAADGSGIEFQLPAAVTPADAWRWSEQWIPHAAWLFVAIAHHHAAATPKTRTPASAH